MPRLQSHTDFKDYKLIFAIQMGHLFDIVMFINMNDKVDDEEKFILLKNIFKKTSKSILFMLKKLNEYLQSM
jgi:hypothetical protein